MFHQTKKHLVIKWHSVVSQSDVSVDNTYRLEQSFQWTPKLLLLKIKVTTATRCFLSLREGTLFSSTTHFLSLKFILVLHLWTKAFI
jgi:hypothetical protein